MVDPTPKEDLVTAFVEAFNAGLIDELDRLLAPDLVLVGMVEDEATPARVFEELKLRSPWTTLARAEVGFDPVAALWVPDQNGRSRLSGFLAFEASDTQITRVEVHEVVPDELLAEEPPPSWVAAEVRFADGELPSDPILG